MDKDQGGKGSGHSSRTGRPLSVLTDLNDLEVFARVVEASGFSRAARELGVPASTVSRRVARLEDALGVRLLQRTTRTMHLTEAGRSYFERVNRALRDIESAEDSLRAVQGKPQGLVRVSTINEAYIQEVLLDFMEAYPDVSLEIDESHDRVDLVAEGYDIALRTGVLSDSSLIAHKLVTSSPRLCASPSYLDAREAPQSVGELRDHDCIILGNSSTVATWQLSSKEGNLQRVNVSGKLAVNDFSSAVQACRRGIGIGLFPSVYVETWLRSGELVVILPELAPPPWGLWIVYPSRRLLSPAVRALIEFLKNSFQKKRLS